MRREFVTRHAATGEATTTAEAAADAPHAKDVATVERRFMIEYVRELRIKVDARGRVFYLDVLTAIMHHIKGFNSIDLSAISENTTNALTATLSNMVATTTTTPARPTPSHPEPSRPRPSPPRRARPLLSS